MNATRPFASSEYVHSTAPVARLAKSRLNHCRYPPRHVSKHNGAPFHDGPPLFSSCCLCPGQQPGLYASFGEATPRQKRAKYVRLTCSSLRYLEQLCKLKARIPGCSHLASSQSSSCPLSTLRSPGRWSGHPFKIVLQCLSSTSSIQKLKQ